MKRHDEAILASRLGAAFAAYPLYADWLGAPVRQGVASQNRADNENLHVWLSPDFATDFEPTSAQKDCVRAILKQAWKHIRVMRASRMLSQTTKM